MSDLFLYDADECPTRAGDVVYFTYGIPLVRVEAKIVDRNGVLIALTPGHTPAECRLDALREYVGEWFRLENKSGYKPKLLPLNWDDAMKKILDAATAVLMEWVFVYSPIRWKNRSDVKRRFKRPQLVIIIFELWINDDIPAELLPKPSYGP